MPTTKVRMSKNDVNVLACVAGGIVGIVGACERKFRNTAWQRTWVF